LLSTGLTRKRQNICDPSILADACFDVFITLNEGNVPEVIADVRPKVRVEKVDFAVRIER